MTTESNTKIAAKLRELADLFDAEEPTATPATGWATSPQAPPVEIKPLDVPCRQCGGTLRIVPAGVSRKTGRPYREFVGCAICD